MGKVTGNWVTGAHSGRACKHENIYTKVNKKTGACNSVKLCNPNDNSVLILVAQLLVLCATFLGIRDFKLPK